MITIRLASRSDLAAIVEIFNQGIAAQATAYDGPVTLGEREGWFESHHASTHPIWVATAGPHVLGWASLSPYRPGRGAVKHTAEVSYYVHQAHRRQGVASALARHCLDACPRLGLSVLFAILLDNNTGSVALLERLGFERWGFMPDIADFGGQRVGHLYYGRAVDPAK